MRSRFAKVAPVAPKPRQRPEMLIARLIVPVDEREERPRVLVPLRRIRAEDKPVLRPPEDRNDRKRPVPAPREREDPADAMLRVELAERPKDIELIVVRPSLPVLRVERPNSPVVIGLRVDRPGNRQRRLAPVRERPEVQPILDPSGVARRLPVIERRRLHRRGRASAKERDRHQKIRRPFQGNRQSRLTPPSGSPRSGSLPAWSRCRGRRGE